MTQKQHMFWPCFRMAVTAMTLTIVLVSALMTVAPWFGVHSLIVYSGSMEPEIPTGSLVFLKESRQSYEIGEIVTCRIDGPESVLVTHRIVAKEPEGYRMKGDANSVADSYSVPPEKILGKVVWHIPGAGYLAARLTWKARIAGICWILALNLLSGSSSVLKGGDHINTKTKEGEREPEAAAKGTCDKMYDETE